MSCRKDAEFIEFLIPVSYGYPQKYHSKGVAAGGWIRSFTDVGSLSSDVRCRWRLRATSGPFRIQSVYFASDARTGDLIWPTASVSVSRTHKS
jgi:hypothetical protein